MTAANSCAQRVARVGANRDAAIGLEEVLREEVQLPRQLFDVERDAVRQNAAISSSAPRRCSVAMSATACR